MPTLTEAPPTGTTSGLRLAAMKCLADNVDADTLRAWAEDTEFLAHMAERSGRPAKDIADEMLAVSVVVCMIVREGVTRDHCRFVLGIDKTPAPALVPSAA